IPDAELRQILPIKPGDVFSGFSLREAMAALYRTGRYSNLSVEATSTTSGLTLTFVTENHEFNGNVDVVGTPGSIAKGGLINAAKLPLGQQFDPSQLNQSVEAMEAELRVEGFYESRVRYEVTRDALHQQANIKFFIDPGPRARFTSPSFRGTLLLPEEKLIKATHWKHFWSRLGWRYVNEQRVQSGIRGILQSYRKREHLMATVQLERLDYQPKNKSALPSLKIEAGPKVEVRAVGVKIGKTTLRKLVPIYEEQSVDKDLLIEGDRKVSAYLRGKGFFDAKVTYEVEQDGQPVDEIDPKKDAYIDYNVERGQRFKVAELLIKGNRYFDRTTLLERIAIRPATILRYRQGRYSDELLAGDRAAIEELYRSNGFLNVKVTSAVARQHKGQANLVAITINIEESAQTRVESVRIEGIAESDQDLIQSYLGVVSGQPYSALTINSDRTRILNLFYQTGYSEAALDVRVERGSTPDQVQLVYAIQSGKQHFVREVVVTGLKNTNNSLVDKRIRLKPGDPLSNNEVFASQRRLYDLGIFAKVDTAQQNAEGQEISKIILFNLEEASKLSFSGGLGAEITRIGGGVTSFDYPAGGAGFSPMQASAKRS
ncbi:MAG: hypothetical protein NTW74_19050, partial [Acidobacteria bacterium]|nr:hypothetical protein [Acidobacteriota bacterium]